ncbi:hypothetical protein VTN31DRAFT_3829 [Thermomyces dupontii]|uniref:uncharacterized protein n=1 Tax=Talaromyces thermophilus TaxID=28565 RepID=UPI0037447F09
MSGSDFSILQGNPPPEESIEYRTLYEELYNLPAKEVPGRLFYPKTPGAGAHYTFTTGVGTGHSEFNLLHTQKHIIAKVYYFSEVYSRLTRREQIQVLAADIEVVDSLQTGQRGPAWTLDSDELRTASHLQTDKVGYYILPITFHHEAAYNIRSITLRFIWHRMQGRGPDAIYERQSRGMRLMVWKQDDRTEMREIYQPWREVDKAISFMERRLQLPSYRQTGGSRRTIAASFEISRRWKAVVTSPGFQKSTKLRKENLPSEKKQEKQQGSSAVGPADNSGTGEQSTSSRTQTQESKQDVQDKDMAAKDEQELIQMANRIMPLTAPLTPWMEQEPRQHGQITNPGPASGDLKSLRPKPRDQEASDAISKGKKPVRAEHERGHPPVAAVDDSNLQVGSQRRDAKGKKPDVREFGGQPWQGPVFTTNLQKDYEAVRRRPFQRGEDNNLMPAGISNFTPPTKSGPNKPPSPRRHVQFADEEPGEPDKRSQGQGKKRV